MTPGTSLSEAELGRPSLLQAAVCYPGTSTDTPAHGAQHPAPVYPAPGTQHPAPSAPPPITASTQHRRPVSTTAHCPLTAPALRPLSLPRALPAPSTGTVSPPRAQPAHSTQHQHHSPHQHPASAPSTSTGHVSTTRTGPAPGTAHPVPAPCLNKSCLHHVHSQLRARSTGTGAGTGAPAPCGTLSPPRSTASHPAHSTRHQHRHPVTHHAAASTRHQHQHPVSTTCTASSPAPACTSAGTRHPCLHHVHSQLTSTQHQHRKRAQAAHCYQPPVSTTRAQPAHSTSAPTPFRKRAHPA